MAPFVVTIAVALFVIVIVKSIRSNQINNVYARLARRYRGQVHRGGLFHMPHLRFVYKGAHVLVDTLYSSFPNRLRSETQFHISWPDHHLNLQISPARLIVRLRNLLAHSLVRLGSPHFDRRFHVMGNDPEGVRQFMSGGVQHIVDSLRQSLHSSNLRISLSHGILVIRRPGMLRDYDDLERLTRLGSELFDQAMLTRLAGIEIVAESSVVVSGDAQCKICGEDIHANVVYCLKCRTPHHHDCWQYYGACSTYGCGESKYSYH